MLWIPLLDSEESIQVVRIVVLREKWATPETRWHKENLAGICACFALCFKTTMCKI